MGTRRTAMSPSESRHDFCINLWTWLSIFGMSSPIHMQEIEVKGHTHASLKALCPGLPRKVKSIWILLKQEIMNGSGISWAICKSAPHSRQITTPVYQPLCFFTDRMPFLPPNQQRQSWLKIECKQTDGYDRLHYHSANAVGADDVTSAGCRDSEVERL